jgi:Concanavalin A-like lectin/glucanases superfamily/Bacterial Ig-like domain
LRWPAPAAESIRPGVTTTVPRHAGSRRAAASLSVLLAIAATAIGVLAGIDSVAADTPSYSTAVLTDSPRAYWRLGELTGTTASSQVNALNGAYQGGMLLGRPGSLLLDPDTSVSLDGTDDSVRVPHSTLLAPSNALSLELWAKPSTLPSGNAVASLMRKDGQYQLAVTSTGRVRLRLWHGGVVKEALSPVKSVSPGVWAHIVATWDGTKSAIWIDGIKRIEEPAAGVLDGGVAALYLGASYGTADRFAGLVDEAAVYGAALPAARIAAHRDAAKSPPPDVTPPAVTLVQPASGSHTTDTTPQLSGAAGVASGDIASVSVSVYAGTTVTATPVQTVTTSASAGAWTVDAAPALPVGTYTAQARQSDSAGNLGQSAASTFTIDAPPPTGYAATVLGDEATAYWRLNETGAMATAVDQRGTSPGAYRGGVLLAQQGALAGTDTAVSLDGVNDTVRVLDTPALNSAGALSFEAWVKPSALPASTASIARKEGQLQLRLMSTGSVRARLWKAANPIEIATPAGALIAGVWQHVAVTFDGAAARLYVDGALSASGAIAAPIDLTTNALTLGSSVESYDWFAGALDEVALYGKALTPERVQAHAAAVADTTAPQVTLTAPVAGSTTTDATPALAGGAGTAAGDSDTVKIEVHGGALSGPLVQTLTTTRLATSWARDADALVPGTYTVRAEQSDAVGNVGRSAAVTFTVAAPPPPVGYRGAVLQDSPRTYWRLNETSGTTVRDEVGATLASYRGGVLLGRSGALASAPDPAVGLNGLNAGISVLSGPNGNSGAMTFETWLLPTTMPASSASIARKDGQYLVRLQSNGAAVFRLWKGAVAYELASPAGTVGDGAWTHLVASWDGTTMRIYANAVLVASRALAAPADVSLNSLTVGSSFNSYDWFAGALDEAAFYDTALPEARVRAHFDASAGADTQAPLLTMPAPAAGSTMDPLPNFGGRAGRATGDLPTVTVKVYAGSQIAGDPVRTATAARSAGNGFSVRLSTPLPDGTYTARAEQADQAGNVGRGPATTFSVVAGDPVILGAGDIVGCDTTGDEATADLLDRLPGLVTTLGDHVYETGSESEFNNCYDETWGRHKARTAPTIGGHEHLSSPNASAYYGYFGAAAGDPTKGYYSFDLGGWHLISLNMQCTAIGGCDRGSPQEEWLRQDLAAHPVQCTAVLMHEPRFSSGGTHGASWVNEGLFQDMYEANADLVLSGDDHIYERFAPQTTLGELDPVRGIRQFVVGTGGRSLYAFGPTIMPNSEVRSNEAFGVLQVTLHAGSYEWKFVPVAGQTFTDAGTTACH